jgi:hypothetical protein
MMAAVLTLSQCDGQKSAGIARLMQICRRSCLGISLHFPDQSRIASRLPDSEVRGLLALMLLHESRRESRVSEDGEIILLEDQDRSRWDQQGMNVRSERKLLKPPVVNQCSKGDTLSFCTGSQKKF